MQAPVIQYVFIYHKLNSCIVMHCSIDFPHGLQVCWGLAQKLCVYEVFE